LTVSQGKVGTKGVAEK